MGPSGAGKSTFLDLLSKRATPTLADASVSVPLCLTSHLIPTLLTRFSSRCQITFDGASKFDMRDLATYVEQDDALLGVLTVEETVTYAAKLRFVAQNFPSLACGSGL